MSVPVKSAYVHDGVCKVVVFNWVEDPGAEATKWARIKGFDDRFCTRADGPGNCITFTFDRDADPPATIAPPTEDYALTQLRHDVNENTGRLTELRNVHAERIESAALVASTANDRIDGMRDRIKAVENRANSAPVYTERLSDLEQKVEAERLEGIEWQRVTDNEHIDLRGKVAALRNDMDRVAQGHRRVVSNITVEKDGSTKESYAWALPPVDEAGRLSNLEQKVERATSHADRAHVRITQHRDRLDDLEGKTKAMTKHDNLARETDRDVLLLKDRVAALEKAEVIGTPVTDPDARKPFKPGDVVWRPTAVMRKWRGPWQVMKDEGTESVYAAGLFGNSDGGWRYTKGDVHHAGLELYKPTDWSTWWADAGMFGILSLWTVVWVAVSLAVVHFGGAL